MKALFLIAFMAIVRRWLTASPLKFDKEELAARGGVFKRMVPRIYNYTCCISSMRTSGFISLK
jgi:hypothetical protein